MKNEVDKSELEKKWVQSYEASKARQTKAQAAGQPALQRLAHIALGDTGQCRIVALFLLGLYDGRAWPLNLQELRGLDDELFDDVMAVLTMDSRAPEASIQKYIDNGKAFFARLTEWYPAKY